MSNELPCWGCLNVIYFNKWHWIYLKLTTMREGWKVLKFHETIIELQSKEPWKMDLNGNSDYKLHGRAGWVGCFQGPGTTGMWRMRMSWRAQVWPLSLSLFFIELVCVYMGMCTEMSGKVFVCMWARVATFSFPLLIVLFYIPPASKLGQWVLRQLLLSCLFSWLEQCWAIWA